MSELKNTIDKVIVVLVVIAILVSGLTFNSIAGLRTGLEGKTDDLGDSINDLGDSIGELVSIDSALISAIGDIEKAVGESGETVSELMERLESLEKSIEESEDEEPAEKVVLKIGLSSAFETMDPPIWYNDLLNGVGQLVTEPLTRLREEYGETVVKPVLAESWERIDDLTWIFKLKKGVKFSDGSDFTAKDVWYSIWGRQENRPPNFFWSIDERVENMEIIDDYTIKVTTKFPIPNMPIWLCHGFDSIMSYEQVKSVGQENEYPITGMGNVLGTGPYMWTEIEPMLFAKMTLNPYWRGETPQITDIEIYYLPDEDARVAALESGSVDFIHPTPIEAVDMLKDKGFTIWRKPSITLSSLVLNNILSPLDDPLVRKALAYAINYEELRVTIMGEEAGRALSVVPGADLGAGEFPYYDYDPAKAKQLLEEAGYPEGITLRWAVRATITPRSDELTAAIQAYWREVGIYAEIDMLERSTYNEIRLTNRNKYLDGEDVDFKYHLFYWGWHSDTLYAGDDMFSLYRSFAPHNVWYYHNPVVDELIEFSMSDAPLEERLEAGLEAQQIMMEDCASIPLFTDPYISTSVPEYTGHIILPNLYQYFGEGRLAP